MARNVIPLAPRDGSRALRGRRGAARRGENGGSRRPRETTRARALRRCASENPGWVRDSRLQPRMAKRSTRTVRIARATPRRRARARCAAARPSDSREDCAKCVLKHVTLLNSSCSSRVRSDGLYASIARARRGDGLVRGARPLGCHISSVSSVPALVSALIRGYRHPPSLSSARS